MLRPTLLALAFIALGVPLASAADAIRVDDAWSRATPAGAKAAAVYMSLSSDTPDKLIGIETPVAAKAQTHSSMMESGIMKMRPVEAIPIEPGKPVELAPGGLHVMLEGLKQPLKEGDTFPMTLRFEKAGERQVTVKVEKPAGRPPVHKMGHG